jgi:ketosteroid isomerase-like protein
MAERMAERFMRTLQQIEQTGDVEPLVVLFDQEAEVGNLVLREPRRGQEGVREFWSDYLKSFGKIRSEFNHSIERDGLVVLEWISKGSLPTGQPIEYRGVSILETSDDRVQRFRTYYDSAAIALEYAR